MCCNNNCCECNCKYDRMSHMEQAMLYSLTGEKRRVCKSEINRDMFRALYPQIQKYILKIKELQDETPQTANRARENQREQNELIDILSEYIVKYSKFD